MAEVKLLSEPTNYAVVHLPGRAYPGVVFQGDSLNTLINELRRVSIESDVEGRSVVLGNIVERLEGVQKGYEAVLDREGIDTPYMRRSGS
jgi:hypothetical protein